jgi:hypothetical protein
MPGDQARTVSRAIYEAVFETVRHGTRTADLDGHALTDQFAAAVIEAVRAELEVWHSLGVRPSPALPPTRARS